MSEIRDRLSDGVTRERLTLEAKRSRRPVLVMLVALALAAACGAVIAHYVDIRLPWQNVQVVRVMVDDANGVKPGLQYVRIHGLQVGRITDSELRGGRAVLTLEVRSKYGEIYRDARIRVRPQTPLQDMYVDIVDRGTPSAGRVGSAPLPATQAESSVDLGAVLNTFQGDTRKRLRTLIDSLGAGLNDKGDALRQTIGEVAPFLRAAQRLSTQTARRGGLTRRLVHNLRLLTDELGSRNRQLTTLVARADATLGATGAVAGSLEDTIEQLPSTLRRTVTSLASVRRALTSVDPALASLRPTARALRPGLDALERITRSAAPALSALRTPVDELRPLARALRPTARDLSTAFASLSRQAPRFDTITRQIVRCKLQLGKFFVWTPSVFKFSDAYGVIPRGDAAEGSAALGGFTKNPGQSLARSCVDR